MPFVEVEKGIYEQVNAEADELILPHLTDEKIQQAAQFFETDHPLKKYWDAIHDARVVFFQAKNRTYDIAQKTKLKEVIQLLEGQYLVSEENLRSVNVLLRGVMLYFERAIQEDLIKKK